MKATFDTNILIYAFDPRDEGKRNLAEQILTRMLEARVVVPMQVLGEALNAAQKKRALNVAQAREACSIVARRCIVEPASKEDLFVASELTERHRLQFFDALICAVARRSGAVTLITEDMQDGMNVDGLRVLDPFRASNKDALSALGLV